jgi:hypothetical protein
VRQFHQRMATAAAGAVIDPGLARAGAELFVALAAPSAGDVLLCSLP